MKTKSQSIFHILLFGGLLASMLGAVQVRPVHATGNITVNTTDGGLADGGGLGACSLAEAITNANADAQTYLDCATGVGADTIDFSIGTATITLSANLPIITDPDGLTIDGGGTVTVNGGDALRRFDFNSAGNTLENITVTHVHNTVSTGAIYVESGASLTISGDSITNNTAVGTGAGVENDAGTLVIKGSYIGSNSAGYGGAVYTSGGTTKITNSTFDTNSATSAGGAVMVDSGTVTIADSTFSGNSDSANNGAAVAVNTGTAHLYNNILANSSAGEDCVVGAGAVDGTNNLIEDSSPACGFSDGSSGNIVGHDPMLLSTTGSPAYFLLDARSPAIDAGDNSSVPGGVTTDQGGAPRFVDAPWVYDKGSGTAPIVDMGSHEYAWSCGSYSNVFVDASASGQKTGTSWTDATNDLQLGLATAAACPGNDVHVAQGVYKPDGAAPGNVTLSFNIPTGVKVYGGYPSGGGVNADPAANLTILSGDVDNNDANFGSTNIDNVYTDISLNNSHQVVYMDGTTTPITSSTVLDGFVITGGKASGAGDASDGGGLYCNGYNGVCSPTLSRLVFSGNTANDVAGALESYGGGTGVSAPTITDTTFRGNHANSNAGAVMNYANSTSSPTFTNVTFAGNSAGGSGGAMVNAGSGGTSSPTLANVTFNGNTAGSTGGAMYNIGYSTSSGHSNPVLKSVTFEGNSANSGGAIENQTFSPGTTSATMTNVILWGDSATTSGAEINNDPGTIGEVTSNLDHSVVAVCPAGSTCTNQVTGDPLLIALASNGGFTQTMALPSGSSALYTGDNATCGSAPVNNTSQNGVTRPQGLTCDIGAYEMPVTKVTFTTKSMPEHDGWILETSENSNVGGTLDSGSTTIRLGDDASRRQYRGLVCFLTSPLPDNAVITSVILKLKKQGVTGGGNPVTALQGFMLDVKKGTFGTSALQAADFKTTASHTYGPLNTALSGGFYTIDLTSGASFINLATTGSGMTQMRVRFKKDDDNNTKANYLSLFSGNAPSASQPELIVQYYLP